MKANEYIWNYRSDNRYQDPKGINFYSSSHDSISSPFDNNSTLLGSVRIDKRIAMGKIWHNNIRMIIKR